MLLIMLANSFSSSNIANQLQNLTGILENPERSGRERNGTEKIDAQYGRRTVCVCVLTDLSLFNNYKQTTKYKL